MNYTGRIAALRHKMEKAGVSGVFLANDATWEYFSGLPRGGHGNTKNRQNSQDFSCLLVTATDVTAFSPRLSALGFSGQMERYPAVTRLVLYPDVDMDGAAFDSEIRAQGLAGKRLAVNRDISSLLTLRLQQKHDASVSDFSPVVDAMRAVKDAEEIALMRHASEVADKIYYDVLPMLVPGTPIREIEWEIEGLLELYECSYTSFPAEVLHHGSKAGGGVGNSYPVLQRDHTVAFDYGVVYRGYCSDFGRTVFLQEPSAELVRYHELVMRAQREALERCVIGVTACRECNDFAHEVMREAGMDDRFIHRMGHGIGMDVHERPFMAEGEDATMRPGMCFTDEPSIFIPHKCLIRVEDVVLVTETGFEYLNQVTKEIVVAQ